MYARVAIVVAAVFLGGCVPKPTAADAEKVVREVLADINGTTPQEVVMDRPIGRPPLDSDADEMMEAVSQLQRRFEITLSDREVKRMVGVEDIDEAPSRLTPDHLVRLVKTALYEQKK